MFSFVYNCISVQLEGSVNTVLVSEAVLLRFRRIPSFNVHPLIDFLLSIAHMVGLPRADNPAVKPESLSLCFISARSVEEILLPICCTVNANLWAQVIGILHIQCFSNYGNKTFAACSTKWRARLS